MKYLTMLKNVPITILAIIIMIITGLLMLAFAPFFEIKDAIREMRGK